MAENKTAMTRYKLIDEMLANRYRALSIQDITDELSEILPDYGQKAVTKRCVEKDLRYLMGMFVDEITEYWVDALDKNGRTYRKRCIRYEDPTFSIFKSKLSEDEKAVLATALDTLGSFDGLENFEWISDLRKRLKLEKQQPIISISKNILSNSNLLARLFSVINQKLTITLEYHKFKDKTIRRVDITPYLLKEYNNRWFLIASTCDTSRILTFALDRIDNFNINHSAPYIKPPIDIEERYDEIIGVTYYEDKPLEEIVFWISENSKDYIETKPIHGSQTPIKKEREQALRDKYPIFKDGAFFFIECKKNYELIQVLASFGPDLIVVSPTHIIQEISNRISAMRSFYESI